MKYTIRYYDNSLQTVKRSSGYVLSYGSNKIIHHKYIFLDRAKQLCKICVQYKSHKDKSHRLKQ